MTSTDLIDEEMTPDFLRRKAFELGHTMTEWEEPDWEQLSFSADPEWDSRCTCADCGADIQIHFYLDQITDGNGEFVGFEERTEITGTAHTAPCPTYHLHYSTMFPFLPKPRKSILNKTKKG